MSSQFPYHAEFMIPGDRKILENTLHSLEPELEHTDRTKMELEIQDENLILKISAADSTALRAAVNSHLRWLSEVMSICERTQD